MAALPLPLAALRRAPRSSLVALAALVVGLLVSVVEPLLPNDGVSDTRPFVDAVRAKAGELRAGDTVLVHPPWRHDVLDALDEAGVLPSGANATVALALPHGQAPGRVLVVVDPGAPPLPRARRRQLDGLERVGAVDVGWLTGGDADGAMTADLGGQIALARVHVEKPDGSRVPCAWDDGRDRHVCRGLPDWMYVGVESLLVGGEPSRCVWSHPITGGKVVIRFPSVRLGDQLVLSHALSDSAAGTAGGASVTAELSVDGARLGSATRSNRAGWAQQTFRSPSPGEPAEVTVAITTPNDGARHYCWRLTSKDASRDAAEGTTP